MNRKGSYLLEVVVSITIITSFLLFIPMVNKSSCEVKKDYFIETLRSDIQYGLSYTMTHCTLINVYFISDQNYYVMVDGNLDRVLKRNYDNTFSLYASRIQITHGYVLKTVILSISCENTSYQIIINEKSGMIDESS
ncbi:hypothetical protein KHQ81_05720 [Mycoplasmatota bacterium]|nr:hypothetical protein KHQ81_05720 [Mycoplasmatota bacterium]